MNRTLIVYNKKIDKNNYLEDRTVCKSCYNKNRRGKGIITSHEQPKIENVNYNKNNVNNPNASTCKNHAHVGIGPKNVGKIYYMLNIFEKIGRKTPTHIITRSTNQYPKYKTIIGIKPIDDYKGSVVRFDGMVGARNSSQIVEFFTSGIHENLDVFYISQSYFILPRQSNRNNTD